MACWYPSPWWPRWQTAEAKANTPKKASKPRKTSTKKKEPILN